MIIKLLKQLLFVPCVLIFQVAFFSNAAWPLYLVDLVLIILIVMAEYFDFQKVIAYALIWGVLLDLFSGLFFPAITISLILTLFLLRAAFNRFFTNRSLYSIVILICLGVLLNNSFYNCLSFVQILLTYNQWDWWMLGSTKELMVWGAQAALNAFIGGAIYLSINYWNRNFQKTTVK
jgi:hypothetical protein